MYLFCEWDTRFFCLNKYTNKNMSESGEYFLPPEALRVFSEGFRSGILPKR